VLQTVVDLDRHMRAEGFERRAPSGEVAAQDEGVCAMLACRACRRGPLTYRPYVATASACQPRARYRPVAACDNCGQALEF
jgi:hypothetical protein